MRTPSNMPSKASAAAGTAAIAITTLCCLNRTASASFLPVIAGVLLGVAVGRASKSSQSKQNETRLSASTPSQSSELFRTEGWEGEADVSDWEPFRLLGRSMIDYIADYYESAEARPVRAQVEPGYLKPRLKGNGEFPAKGEKWSDIMADVEAHIMPGITHWQHPRFFAWYPANSSPPAILGDLLASMFNVIGFSWEASPAATELETVVLDQLGRAVGLPETFLSKGEGGGVIQGSASEGTLVGLLAARTKALKHMRKASPGVDDHELLSKMTLYTSDQAHSSVQKAANIAGLGESLRLVSARYANADEGRSMDANEFALDAADLAEVMEKDVALGLTPMFVAANVGTTNSCAIDPVRALAKACRDSCARNGRSGEGAEVSSGLVPWLHVDAAYAGSAAVCPENRWILDGIEHADSFLFNLHKWLMVNFDCTAMWVKRSAYLVDALSVTPEILRSKEYQQGQVSDFRDWQVPLGRKFRSLKIWLTMRAFGLDKMKGLIRRHTQLAADFEAMVNEDKRFELVAPVRFGLVCFRLKASDAANEAIRSRIISSGLAFFSSTKLRGRTCLRVCVGFPATEIRHVRELWTAVLQTANVVIAEGL